MGVPKSYGCSPIPHDPVKGLYWPELVDLYFSRGLAARKLAASSKDPQQVADAKRLEQQCMTNGGIYGAKIGAAPYMWGLRRQRPADAKHIFDTANLPPQVMYADDRHSMQARAQDPVYRVVLEEREVAEYDYPPTLDILLDSQMFAPVPLEPQLRLHPDDRHYTREMIYTTIPNGSVQTDMQGKTLIDFDGISDSRSAEIIRTNHHLEVPEGGYTYEPSDGKIDVSCVGRSDKRMCEIEQWLKPVAAGYKKHAMDPFMSAVNWLVPQAFTDPEAAYKDIAENGWAGFMSQVADFTKYRHAKDVVEEAYDKGEAIYSMATGDEEVELADFIDIFVPGGKGRGKKGSGGGNRDGQGKVVLGDEPHGDDKNILKLIQNVNAETPKPFYKQALEYVDETEKRGGNLKVKGNGLEKVKVHNFKSWQIPGSDAIVKIRDTPGAFPEHVAELWFAFEFSKATNSNLEIAGGTVKGKEGIDFPGADYTIGPKKYEYKLVTGESTGVITGAIDKALKTNGLPLIDARRRSPLDPKQLKKRLNMMANSGKLPLPMNKRRKIHGKESAYARHGNGKFKSKQRAKNVLILGKKQMYFYNRRGMLNLIDYKQ